MAGLKNIKNKIRSTEKTHTVTRAMEAVSASKMRKAQLVALSTRAYARAASAVLARLSSARELKNHPLAEVRPVSNALYIVITSDKGLAGGLNSGVLRAAYADMQASGLSAGNTSVIAIGRKAQDFFASRNVTIATFHPNTSDVSTELIDEIVSEAAQRFATGAVDVVKIVYQNFVSTFEQRPTIQTMFPLSLAELEHIVRGILPTKGAFSKEEDISAVQSYTVEPSDDEVLNAILPKLASIFIYHALLESQASEHSARMVAMKSASDKAQEMKHSLTLQFNKARQAAITREVSEIIGGMEAIATQ